MTFLIQSIYLQSTTINLGPIAKLHSFSCLTVRLPLFFGYCIFAPVFLLLGIWYAPILWSVGKYANERIKRHAPNMDGRKFKRNLHIQTYLGYIASNLQHQINNKISYFATVTECSSPKSITWPQDCDLHLFFLARATHLVNEACAHGWPEAPQMSCAACRRRQNCELFLFLFYWINTNLSLKFLLQWPLGQNEDAHLTDTQIMVMQGATSWVVNEACLGFGGEQGRSCPFLSGSADPDGFVRTQ